MHVSVSATALIICRWRSWAEGSAGPPPTLAGRVRGLFASSLRLLRSCFTANDPTKRRNDEEPKLPAAL